MTRERAARPPAATGVSPEFAHAQQLEATLIGASGRPLVLNGLLCPGGAPDEAGLHSRTLSFTVGEPGEDGRVRLIDPHRRNPVEVERIELTAAQTALDAVRPARSGGPPPLIVLPLSWSTVRNPRARRKLQRLVAAARRRTRAAVRCEILGVETETPPPALEKTVSDLRTIFQDVLIATGAARGGPQRPSD